MIEFHNSCPRHEFLNQSWRVAIEAQIHIVKAACRRCAIKQISRQMPSLRINLMQRSEINPIYRSCEQSIALCGCELREIVGSRPVKNEFRLSISRECNRCGTSLVIFVDRQIFRSEVKLRHTIDNLLSPLVLAHSTDE